MEKRGQRSTEMTAAELRLDSDLQDSAHRAVSWSSTHVGLVIHLPFAMVSNTIFLSFSLSVSARRLEDASASKTRTFDLYQDFLKSALSNTPLGMVWLPGSKVFLGREAGKVARAILMKPRRDVGAAAEGPALRTPILEISFFLSHKLSPWVGAIREYLLSEDRSVEQILRSFSLCRSTRITHFGPLKHQITA